ncbi:TPA: recombination protein NinG [Escherichia coli]|nr:recombination protein NinG [Escherichia coli]
MIDQNRSYEQESVERALTCANRIGQEAVDEIESNHSRHRWTVEECKAIKAEYQQKLKDLRNSRSEAA